ncbi:MAG: helicase-related protein, partial [Spirochaetales bacterium]
MREAASAATGTAGPTIVLPDVQRAININLIAPPQVDTFPWSGHLGRSMVEPLLNALDITVSTIIFCNTRNQAEKWYQEIIGARPQWLARVALPHGSIDRKTTEEIEARMLDGRLKWVVATSSLDLGIDFHPVERVVQIGSAKGVSRLMQRAGGS